MRLHYLFGLLVVFIASSALAQPRIEFETRSYDFGTAYPNQELVNHFVFENKGNEPLIIHKVETSCGCTAAVLSATSVPPSATGVLKITMTASVVPLQMSKRSMVHSNDSDNPVVTLTTIANVRNVWLLSPRKSFALGDIPFGATKTQELMLKNIDGDPFEIKGTKVNQPEIKVDVGEPTEKGVPITVTVAAGETKKALRDTLEIRTNHPEQPYCQVQVSADIVGYVQFKPERVYFGSIKKGSKTTREITVSLTKPELADQFSITNITSEPLDVEGEIINQQPNGVMKLRLSLVTPDKTGYHAGKIYMKTSLKKDPEATIHYSVLVRP